MEHTDDLKKIIRDAGFKATPARLAILGLFTGDCGALCVEDVYKKLSKTGKMGVGKNAKLGKTIDMVTVYRTLESFEKAGIVKRVYTQRQAAYYERAGHHHHHIVCTSCGTVESFDACEVKDISKQALSQSSQFKSISDHSFELFGLCNICVKK